MTMKKLLYLALIVLTFGACTDNLTDLNVDTKKPTEVPSGTLFANATVELMDMMTSTNVNINNLRLWAQHWAQTTYPDESNYELVERNVNGRTWNTLYATVLRDVAEARPLIQDDPFLSDAEKANQLAMCDVMEVIAYTLLVDFFGDVPYSQALQEGVFLPTYDDDASVYNAMLDKLNGAINTLSGDSGMGSYDLIYGGDADAWKKFANTYKLRLAIRLADSDDARAKSMVEAAVNSGVFTSSADNFQIQYLSNPPNTNPLWEDLVQSGRSDFVAANTLVDYMNGLEDPRRDVYFSGPVDSLGNPIGGIYGAANNYNANSQAGTILTDPELPGVFLSYTEVRFLLADAAERGYSVGGTTEEHYNAGITSSFDDWGVAGADAYLQNPDVAWSTAPGNWKEKIAMQKWIALYNQGFEAWSTYRLYDAPAMNIADGAGTTPPLRYTYPVSEFSVNGANVESAASAIGGDDLMTPIFWDVN